MKDHIGHWRDKFDHIIIDTPPCLSVTDAVLLSPEADRVILVARSGQTTRPALRRACDLLLQVNARVMGIVLNAFDSRLGDGYYPYDSSYGRYYDDEASPQDGTTATSKVS
jgi:Mrp family chromosome partitioning ATPase